MKGVGSWRIWGLLAACACLIVAAMAWLTREAVEAERKRSLADARAGLEERVRLSLWRMDALASAVVIGENGIASADWLDAPPQEAIEQRFRIEPGGKVTLSGGVTGGEEAEQLRNELFASNGFVASFPLICASVQEGQNLTFANNDSANWGSKVAQGERQSPDYQRELSRVERGKRGYAVNSQMIAQNSISMPVFQPVATAVEGFRASWFDGRLVLLREVQINGEALGQAIDGALVKTGLLRDRLLEEVSDLLPAAGLERVAPGEGDEWTLAALPWRLDPGEVPVATTTLGTPLKLSLGAGWLAALLALVGGAVMIRGVLRLSERRASFVSAVTHELRTPLTTFRLYSDMLDSGAVRDEEKRGHYFRVLRREADRLSHLVENVLAFSRIERGSARAEVREMDVAGLLGELRERFEERLAAADMVLSLDLPAPGLTLTGDRAAIEHVLFNLVDNAAKYAGGCEVRIGVAEADGRWIEIGVADDGPGIAPAEARRIFEPFHKSAHAAAESQPGVGLGLALSRRLAREMGGELSHRSGGRGACFVLRVPKA